MKRHSVLHGLARSVSAHDGVYQAAREREPLLSPHPTPVALFRALAVGSTVPWEARGVLLRVIVLEYQRARHPLWYALAAQALEPMLGRLRSGLRGPTAEREQAIHLAFAAALGRLRVARCDGPVFPLLTLRRALQRALFTTVCDRERAADDEAAYFEHAGLRTQQPHEDAPPFMECFAHEVGDLLIERAGDDGVVRVLLDAETLGEQVERMSGEHVTRECLQKRHRRAVLRVRGEVSRRPR